jgi:RNA polymerase sigma-70 factor, ECF subfamily
LEPAPKSFRPELDKEQSWLRWQARRMLGPRLRTQLDSQDLSHDAQVAALRGLHGRRFENRGAFRGWLSRILGNRVRDLARAQRPAGAQQNSWSQVPGRDASASRVHELDPEQTDLWRRLRVLPERERAVVRMRLVDELSFAELAQRLSISEGNARLLFHRSIRRLRELPDPAGRS